jgi:hypothetical protein
MKEQADFLEESLRLISITDDGLTTTTYNEPPISLLRTNLILPGLAAPVNPWSMTSSATRFFGEDCGVLTIWTN